MIRNHKVIIGIGILSFFFVGCAEKQHYDAKLPPAKLLAQCQKLSQDKKYEKATNCLEALKGRYPGSTQANAANLDIADNQFRQKEYLLAAETYRNFIKLNPVSPRLDYAYYRAGLCYLKETPKAIDRDQQYLGDAIRYFEIVIKYFPHSQYSAVNQEKWEKARRRVASRIYYIGRFYYQQGQYLASVPRFEEVYNNYPGLGIDEKALYYLGLSHIRLSQKLEALDVYIVLESRFPKSSYARRLAKRLEIKN